MKIIVRTWNHTPSGVNHILKTVNLPEFAVARIQQWATSQQKNLLHRKYIDLDKNEVSPQRKEANDELNKLWSELQEEGLRSEDERLAVNFLFSRYRDNPELIDLQVASEFWGQLETDRG